MSVGSPISTGHGRFSDAQHQEIVNRLEALKASGLITGYFVSWIGADGDLNPVVRAWKTPETSEIRIRDHISGSLANMINPSNLTIVDADRSTIPILP
jgi:hypothetical protein